MKSFRGGYVLPVSVFIFTVVALVATDPGFASTSGIFATLSGFGLVGIVAAGVGTTMIAGELDLSAASIAVFAAVLTVQFDSLGLIGSILVATLIAGVIGLIQGWIIAWLQINSLVFTVATLLLIQGAAWLAAGNKPVTVSDFKMTDPLLARWGILSPSIIIGFAVVIAVGVFLAYFRWGREIYAIGGARTEARAAGASVTRSIVIAFALSGFCAGLAGSIQAMKSGSADPDTLQELVLSSVAASLIGGISLHGGRGTMLNIGLGVATVSAITAGMAARGSQAYITELVTGVLLFIVIGVEWLSGWNERRAERAEFNAHIEHHSDDVVTA